MSTSFNKHNLVPNAGLLQAGRAVLTVTDESGTSVRRVFDGHRPRAGGPPA